MPQKHMIETFRDKPETTMTMNYSALHNETENDATARYLGQVVEIEMHNGVEYETQDI